MSFGTTPKVTRTFPPLAVLKQTRALYAGDSGVTDVIDAILADYDALITAGQIADDGATPPTILFPPRPNVCNKCLGEGMYSKDKDTGNTDDQYTNKICDVCGGWGRTEAVATATQSWNISEVPKTEA